MHALNNIGKPASGDKKKMIIAIDNAEVVKFLASALVNLIIQRKQSELEGLCKLLNNIGDDKVNLRAELDCNDVLRPVANVTLVLGEEGFENIDVATLEMLDGALDVIDVTVMPEPAAQE